MPNLFIIGNGFDIAHDLPTKYSDFREFLNRDYGAYENTFLFPPEIIMGNHGEAQASSEDIASLVSRLLLDANVKDDWSDFEEKLGQFDYGEFFDHIEDFGSDDEENPFITGNKMEDTCTSLLDSLPHIKGLFREWINTFQIEPELLQSFKELCNPDADVFLNFNYTLTLEKLYNCKNVCHIHGKQDDYEILVGHGDDSEEAGFFDRVGFPGALCNLTDVKSAFFKNTSKALQDNYTFFESLSAIDKVYSIGFSYNSIDLVYIQEICKCLDSDTVWFINDYKKDRHKFPYFKELIKECGYIGKFEIKGLI